MSTGADNKTLPVTREYEDGYERVFGKKEPERGYWIQHPITGELVPASEYTAPAPHAKDAPVMAGRFYENNSITTMNEKNEYQKRDIGSRRKFKEYLRETGYTHASDYTEAWKKAAEKREKVKNGEVPSKTRRETLERAFHKIRGY